MTSSQEVLSDLRVGLDEKSQAEWKNRYGITDFYLGDIAAGALIEVPGDWKQADDTDKASNKVSDGLRRLLQELWRKDLARPVVAVFYPAERGDSCVEELRRLTWDQSAHRGDFALREASGRKKAEALLEALLGDNLGALDGSARDDKVGIAEVDGEFEKEAAAAKAAGDAPWAAPAERLCAKLRAELQRAGDAQQKPDLLSVLHEWKQAEEVTR